MGQCRSTPNGQSNGRVLSPPTSSSGRQLSVVQSSHLIRPDLLGAILPTIENYNSKRESPQAFCRRIHDSLQLCCEDVAMSKKIIISKFSYYDRAKVDAIPESVRIGNISSLDCFYDALCKALVSKKEIPPAYSQLMSITQSSDIETYANAIHYHYERAFPGFNEPINQDTLMWAFKKGINPSIRKMINNIQEYPTSFLDLVEAAKRMETLIETEKLEQDEDDDEFIAQVNALSIDDEEKSENKRHRSYKGTFAKEAPAKLCYFSTARTKLKVAEGYVIECKGQLTKMNSVNNVNVDLYGAADAIDLLILRGTGEEINWTQQSNVQRIYDSHVCENHLNELLINWKKHRIFNKKHYTNKEYLCALPNVSNSRIREKLHCQKKTEKNEALRFIKATNVLCHVGAVICTPHFNALEEQRIADISFEDNFSDIRMEIDESGSRSPSIQNQSRESSIAIDHRISIKSDDERKKKVQEVTHAFGLNRISSELEWSVLKESVQDKKINTMIRLFDGICTVAAGDHWLDLRNRCVSKMTPVMQDSRIDEIMATISFALENCSIRSVRNRILALVTGTFTEREIIHLTGCTSYDIRQAKLSAQSGFSELKVPFHRVRLNRPVLKEFVSFLALPEITMNIPSPGKQIMLESGESADLAKVIRLFSYREIHRRYIRSIEVLAPSRRRRLQCIDNYQADSMEAFDYLNNFTNELAVMGKIDSTTRTDILRRSRVSSNFISYEQRTHMEKESDTINHCIRYLLSDPIKKEFASPCHLGPRPHTHNSVCTECLKCTDVFDIFMGILNNAYADSLKKKEPESIRIERMIQQMEISKENVNMYRRHQIRSFASEMNRKEILDNLQPKEALIVIDFAMKILPTTSVEVQSQWYKKAGIAYHMAYCVGNLDGDLYHHAFGHSADDLSQDTVSTSAITEDVIKQLKENGIEKVYVRSDNAGNYHNAAFISTLYHFSRTIGVEVIAYVFSEPQSGKGDADREISHSKRKIRDHVDGKGNVRNAADIVTAVTSGTLLKATSAHEIVVNEISVSKSSFTGIASYGSFEFEASGIRARKFDQIGKGVFIEERKILTNQYTYQKGKEGGYLSKSSGFWKKFDSQEDREVENDAKCEDNSEESPKEGIFSCSDHFCTSTFLTIEGLMKHQFRGVHRRRKNSESTIDAGVRIFTEMVQTDSSAALSVKSDSLVSIVPGMHSIPEQGYAMKKPEKAPPMSLEMKEVITDYFNEQRNNERRALARDICLSVKEMKKANGRYRFNLIDCPKESQCQTLISTLLRQEAVGKGNMRKRGRKANNGNESSEDDSLAASGSKRGRKTTQSTGGEKTVKGKGQNVRQKEKKIKLTKEKLRICEDDEFADMMEEIEENADDIFSD